MRSGIARGVRSAVKDEIDRLMPPRAAISVSAGLMSALVARRSLNRWEDRRRLKRIERKLDELATRG